MSFKLEEESKRWTDSGIITAEQRDEILGFYKKKQTYNPVLIVFAILGSLLLGLGVVLIFASNWDNITRTAKLIISFLPLIGSMGAVLFTVLKKNDSAAFREGTSLGLCIAIYATTALVEQVFQIRTSLPEFLSLCMFLSLPALYLFQAKAPAAIYIISAIWVGFSEQMPLGLTYISIIAIAPYFVIQIMKTDNKASLWYLTVLMNSLIVLAVFVIPDWDIVIYKFLISCVAIISLETFIKRIKGSSVYAPNTGLAGIVIIILHIIASFRLTSLHEIMFEDGMSFFCLSVLLCVVGAYAAIRMVKREKNDFKPEAADALVLLAIIGIPMYWLWSNLLLITLGIWFIVSASKSYSFKHLNYGMLVLIGVIVTRFFDFELELFARGIIFILLGAGFIFTNFLLHKKWRKS